MEKQQKLLENALRHRVISEVKQKVNPGFTDPSRTRTK